MHTHRANLFVNFISPSHNSLSSKCDFYFFLLWSTSGADSKGERVLKHICRFQPSNSLMLACWQAAKETTFLSFTSITTTINCVISDHHFHQHSPPFRLLLPLFEIVAPPSFFIKKNLCPSSQCEQMSVQPHPPTSCIHLTNHRDEIFTQWWGQAGQEWVDECVVSKKVLKKRRM